MDPQPSPDNQDIPSLRSSLLADPFNSVLWDSLIQAISTAYQDNSPERTAALREAYESVTLQFPTSTSYFREYCEFEIQAGDPAQVKALFGRCLLVCLDVDLYGLYVDYIKSVSPEDKVQIQECLEFALKHVGWDCRSGGLYVLDSWPFACLPWLSLPHHLPLSPILSCILSPALSLLLTRA